MNIQEVIGHIQSKIIDYRQIQSKFHNIKQKIQQFKDLFLAQQQPYQLSMVDIINQCKKDYTSKIIEISLFYENQIKKVKKECQLQIDDINKDRQRQYSCIRKMKEEIFTLHELINLHNLQQSCKEASNEKEEDRVRLKHDYGGYQSGEGYYSNVNHETINGLEIIAEEDTQRTIVSSVKSFNEEYRYPQNFIKIEEKSSSQFQQYERNIAMFQKQSEGNLRHIQNDLFNYQMHCNQYEFIKQKSLSKSQNSSIKRLEKLLADSNIENRQNTHQYQLISEESVGQYESLPLSVQGSEVRQFHRDDFSLWQGGRKTCKELRDITNEDHKYSKNEVQIQRQEKTKMFLQQFRKTFSKCLSSANVSRKSSTKGQKSSKNNTSRQQKEKANKTLKDIGGILGKDIDRMQNQKIITEMLRDIDYNNKFLVGNRKIELKYEGQRKDGVRHGKGILYYSNGLCYEGEFKNNMRHGSGILRFNLVQLYRGQWQNDELSGQGRLRNFAVINNKRNHNSNNSPLQKWGSYYGFFKNNRFQGEGTLYLSGGQKFLGKFICGLACGQGILYKRSGEVQNGIWRNNQLVERF